MNKTFISLKKTLSRFLLLNLFLSLTISTQAQIYVNQAATGNNDGTSWANAYTELATALDQYQEGDEIWVAAGIYLPQEPSAWPVDTITKRTFYIYRDVQIFGGFRGSETMRSERDPATNLTILSGDLNGDDIPNNFDTTRADNVINVVYIETNISANTVIDGFTIMGGHADIDNDFFPNKRGGGVFSWGAAQISNCTFQQNYTIWHGAGIYYYEKDADGGKLENCLFQENKCLNTGAGITIAQVEGEGIQVENCRFLSNEANRGGGLYWLQSNGAVNNCQFLSNTANIQAGAMYILFNDGIGESGLNVNISNCEFKENHAESGGGAVYYYNYQSTGHQVAFNNCQFLENTSAESGGFSYLAEEAKNGDLILKSCTFNSNRAIPTSADTLTVAGGIGLFYRGLASENDNIHIVDCVIENNSSQWKAGGVYYSHNTGKNNHFQMDNCEIINNVEVKDRAAGGVAIAEGGQSTSVLIRNTLFKDNASQRSLGFALGRSPGAQEPNDKRIELINCLFTNHQTMVAGSVVLSAIGKVQLTNCTLADNAASLLGTAINGKFTLNNNILAGEDFPIYTSLGLSFEPAYINSLGGNLVSDRALDDFLNNTDQSGTDPNFETGTYQLSASSPAIDAGVFPNLPISTDLAGEMRIQGGCIDIGAFESSFTSRATCQLVTSAYQTLDQSSNLTIYPNPISNIGRVRIENDWSGPIDLRIVNTLGQEIWRTRTEKIDARLDLSLDIQDLPSGTYRLLLSNGTAVAVESFIKLDNN